MSTGKLSHVTLLVPSLERSLAQLPANTYRIAPIETFDEAHDGASREAYVGPEIYAHGMLLFVQSSTSRWFAKFTERFGYGLHHIAIDVPSIVDYCEAMNEKGWYLHVGSAWALEKLQSAYLVRPGTPLIIEIQKKAPAGPEREQFIHSILVQAQDVAEQEALQSLGIPGLQSALDKPSSFTIGDKTWDISSLIATSSF